VAALLPDFSKARGLRMIAVGNLVSGTLLALGIVGMLQTKLETTEDLTIITVHPLTAVVWFALGLIGVALCLEPRRAQRYLVATGALLVLWGLLCLVLDGSPSEFFARDPALVALLLVGGALSLGAALTPPIAGLERVLE
jgi:hypothetical protein